MDWTLEPSSPIQFSINAMYKEDLTEANNLKLETYLTKHVRVKDVDGPGGQVCIDNTPNPTFTDCDEHDKAGLFIKGDVRLDKMFGSVGYSTTKDSRSNQTENLPPSEDGVVKIGELTVEKPLDIISAHTIAFFGYLSVDRINGNDYHRYWMQEGSICNTTYNDEKSTHGTFEYQDCCNKASSHTFLHVKKTQNVADHTYSFCVQRSQINKPSYSSVPVDSPRATFSFGLVGYALPEQQ